MTEPIRLYALSKSGVVSTDSDGDPNGRNLMVFVDESEATTTRLDGEEIIELTEVRRCGTCDSFDPDYGENYGMCLCWGHRSNPEGFCHRHDPKKEKTDG